MKRSLGLFLCLTVMIASPLNVRAQSSRVNQSLIETAEQRDQAVSQLRFRFYQLSQQLQTLDEHLANAESQARNSTGGRVLLGVAAATAVYVVARSLARLSRGRRAADRFRDMAERSYTPEARGAFAHESAVEGFLAVGGAAARLTGLLPTYIVYRLGLEGVYLTSGEIRRFRREISRTKADIQAVRTELAEIENGT